MLSHGVGTAKITVAVRVRPLSGASDQCAVSMNGKTLMLLPYNRGCTVDLPLWSVDRSGSYYVDQEGVYEAVGLPIFTRMIEGFNTTLITYGQGGSGKSHSTFGYADPGLFPRIIGALFYHASQDPSAVYKMDMAMYELFEDGSTEAYMRDVLSEDRKSKLGVREDESGGLQVEGLCWVPLQDQAQLSKAVAEACRSRGHGQRDLSDRTRTAHAFVIVRVARFEPSGIARVNKLTIVCIADSDRQAGSPPGSGPENPSVRSLFDTADTLAQGNRPVFSNTLLTWMLRSSLEGDMHTTFLATISPSLSDADETASTLKLAQCFGVIRTHPKVSVSALASTLQNSQAAFVHVPAVGTPSKLPPPHQPILDATFRPPHHAAPFYDRTASPLRNPTFPVAPHSPARSLSPSRPGDQPASSVIHSTLTALQIAPNCFAPSLFEIPQGESRIGSGVSSSSNFALMITGGGVAPLHASLFSDGRGHVQIKREGQSLIRINDQTCTDMADLFHIARLRTFWALGSIGLEPRFYKVDGSVVGIGNAATYVFRVNESNVVHSRVGEGMSGHGPRIPDVPPAQSRLTEGNLMYAAVGTDTANPAALAEWFRNQDLPHTRRGTANGLVNVNLPFGSDTLHPHATFELPRMQISGPRYTQPDSQAVLFEYPRPASPPQGVLIPAPGTVNSLNGSYSMTRRPPVGPQSTSLNGPSFSQVLPVSSLGLGVGVNKSGSTSLQRTRTDIVHGVSMASPEFTSRLRGVETSFRASSTTRDMGARPSANVTMVNSSTNTSVKGPQPSLWSQVNGGANISTPRPELSASTSAAPPHASVSLYPQSQPKQPHISELNDGRSIKLAVPVMNGAQWAEVLLDTEEMLMTMRAQIDQKDHMLGQTLYPKTFRGGLAVDWVLAWIRRCHDSQHGRSSDPQWETTFRKSAEMVFEVMCQRGLIQQQSGDLARPSAHPSYLFSLKGAMVTSPQESVSTFASAKPQPPPDYKTHATDEPSLRSIMIGEKLLRFILRALVLAGDRQCKDTPEFEQFLDLVAEILTLDVSKFSSAQKMAFWLNVYNCLFLHGHIVSALADGTDMKEFLSALMFDVEYRIGGVNYCLDTIFNQILRAPGPAGRCHDPRVHFACVNGTMSSPPIAIYTPENIDEELHIAAERYLQNMVDIRLPNSVVLPRCFKWFAKDFGQTKAQVLRFVAQYLQEPQKQQLLEMAKNPAGVNMQYAEYDWRLWMKQGPQAQGLGPYSTARDCVDM